MFLNLLINILCTLQRIRRERDENNEVKKDFGDDVNKWALESISNIALDTRLNVLNDTDPNSTGLTLVRCVRDFFELTINLELKPSIWKYYPTSDFKKLMKTFDTMAE